jgi:hypothetical protein
MSSTESGSAAAPSGGPPKLGLWQKVRDIIIRTDAELSFLKGLGIVSVLGTLLAGYFQYLSTYHDKVAEVAKDDMAKATAAFTEASNTLAAAITLQDQLFYDFSRAIKLNADGDSNALMSKNAHDLYKPYEDAADALRVNINLMARKMEIYLDWPSDPKHDPADNSMLGVDPISTSLLGAVDFDCDTDMPKFDEHDHQIVKTKKERKLAVDWYSAKHHVLTIAYCFQVTQTWMETVRQWASQSSLDRTQIVNFTKDTETKLQPRLDSEVVRLNAFMSRAMNEIQGIRVKYRPNGFLCHLPVVREAIGIFSRRCTPLRIASVGVNG